CRTRESARESPPDPRGTAPARREFRDRRPAAAPPAPARRALVTRPRRLRARASKSERSLVSPVLSRRLTRSLSRRAAAGNAWSPQRGEGDEVLAHPE